MHESNRKSTWAKAKTLGAIGLWALAMAGLSCVETAECDETILCPETQTCYELVCLDKCEVDSECPTGQSCVACRQDSGTEVIDHCFGRGDRVCLVEDTK